MEVAQCGDLNTKPTSKALNHNHYTVHCSRYLYGSVGESPHKAFYISKIITDPNKSKIKNFCNFSNSLLS